MKNLTIIILISFLLIEINGCKREEWKRNPNLHLLIKIDTLSLFRPLWDPKGKNVYFLTNKYAHSCVGGNLFKFNIEDSTLKCLNENISISFFDIHPSGSLIVASDFYGKIFLIDTNGIILDTFGTSKPKVFDPKFNFSGEWVYFYGCGGNYHTNGIYRIKVDGTGEEFVKFWDIDCTEYPLGFEIDENDSIILSQNFARPRINKVHPQFLIATNDFCSLPDCPVDKIYLIDREKNKFLVLDANPYPPRDCGITVYYYPSWHPNGKDIIFSAAISGGIEGCFTDFEIWILKEIIQE